MIIESAKIVLNSVSHPVQCGVYINHKLFARLDSKEQTSDALVALFEGLLPYMKGSKTHLKSNSQWQILTQLGTFNISSIYYALGPGSFSALKLTHIFLHTLAEIYDISLYGADSFYFKKTPVIKAFGEMYFYKNHQGIRLCKKSEIEAILQNMNTKPNDGLKTNSTDLFSTMLQDFRLPKTLHPSDFSNEVYPLYILPPV